MKRVAKPAGAYNIVLEEVDVPIIVPTEVLVCAECSLISRGSEIWRRYVHEEAIDHRMMGYSLVGRVVEKIKYVGCTWNTSDYYMYHNNTRTRTYTRLARTLILPGSDNNRS